MHKLGRFLLNTAGLVFLIGLILGGISMSGVSPDHTQGVHSSKLLK